MPYEIRKAGSGYKVFKKGTDEAMSKKPLSREDAEAQLQALYANEPETEKAKHDQSVMVALKVPEHIGADLILPLKRMQYPTEDVGQLHVTLCYLGDISEQPMRIDAVVKRVEESLWQFGEVRGKISGYGRFSSTHQEGRDAIYANYDAPILPELRQALYGALKDAGFPVRNDHGYTPHITLAYIPREAETPDMRLPEFKFALQEVTLYWGNVEIPIALKGDRIKGQPATQPGGLTVFKEKDSNRYRWVMLSSNAYRDRDGQIVSEKALRSDVERADADGDYGPLRWWHVPGLDIGTCDFNMMHGRVLIESGTFFDAETAKAMMAAANSLSGSIAFRHPLSEPDKEGVFHTIRRKERSLLPKGKESNPFVSLVEITGDDSMTTIKEKISKFMSLIGDADGEKTQAILSHAESTEKMAQELGAAFKEAGFDNISEDTATVLAEMIAADTDKAKKKPAAKAEEAESEDMEEDEEDEDSEGGEEMVEKLMTGKKEAEAEDEDPYAGREYVGDMSPDEFAGFMAESLQRTVGDRLDAIENRLGAAEKDAGTVARLQAKIDQLETEKAQMEARLSGQGRALKELGADLPPALRGFMMGLGASQDESTIISKEKAASMGPAADPEASGVDSFLDHMFEGTPFTSNGGQ